MQQYDVIVAGAGAIGLSTAYHLAKAGAKVLVLEKGEPGTVASNASGGMVAAQLEPDGETLYQFSLHSRDLYPKFTADLLDESGVDPELMVGGFIELAVDGEAEAHARQMIATQTKAGQRAAWLSPERVEALVPGVAPVKGAFFSPDDLHVMPARLVEALAIASARRGVELITHCEVLRIDDDGTVTTVRGIYKGGTVVLAGGAFSGTLAGGSAVPVFPVQGTMIKVRLPRHLAGPWATGCMPVYGPHAIGPLKAPIYLTPKRDGTVLVGASAEMTFDRATKVSSIADVLQAALQTFPFLKEATVVDSWTGLRPGTPDRQPIIGQLPGRPNIWACTGHFRHGIMLTPATGEAMAALLGGRPTPVDLRAFTPTRFVK